MQETPQAHQDDHRLYDLSLWAREQVAKIMPDLSPSTLQDAAVLAPVSGDASFRRYFRLSLGERTWICVDAPPDKENSGAFVRISELMLRHQIASPRVLSFDLAKGFMLLTDLGDQLLLNTLSPETVQAQYTDAMHLLRRIQQVPLAELQSLPRLDRARLQSELDLFEAWFLPHYLQLTPDAAMLKVMQNLAQILIDEALSQPQVLVHCDYHSRNLMWLNGQSLAQIDFQDAVVGPVTYDLVSLLKDCYVQWPQGQVNQWAQDYAALAEEVGLIESVPAAQWQRWFDWIGLQRHIRICGIFARLCFRDGKASYLNDIPLTVRYVMEVAQRYPEFAEFERMMREKVLPVLYRVNPEAQAIVEAGDSGTPMQRPNR